MKNRFCHTSAFTLVELIVVITILTILGTIAFTSLQKYGTYARNSVRTSDLHLIDKALSIGLSRDSVLPIPDDSIHLTASGQTIVYDGIMGNRLKQFTGVSGELRDPGTDKPYKYISNRNEYTLKSDMNENGIQFSTGNGILLESREAATQTPLYETLSGTIDVMTHPLFIDGTYKFYQDSAEFSEYRIVDNIIIIEGIDSRINFANNNVCNRVSHITNSSLSQTWLSCNMGASSIYNLPEEVSGWDIYEDFVTGTTTRFTDNELLPDNSNIATPAVYKFSENSVGELYHWGATSGLSWMDSVDDFDNDTDGNPVNDVRVDLSTPLNDDKRPNCIVGNNNIPYVYTGDSRYCLGESKSLWDDINSSGLCPNGYHIPAIDEISNFVIIAVGDDVQHTTSDIGREKAKKIKRVLRIPFNGKYRVNGFFWRGAHTTLLSSSSDESSVSVFGFDGQGNFFPSQNIPKTQMGSVRCIKNQTDL